MARVQPFPVAGGTQEEPPVFVVNLNQTDTLAVAAELRYPSGYQIDEQLGLTDDSKRAQHRPDAVIPRQDDDARLDDSRWMAVLSKPSWSVFHLAKHLP